MDAMLGNLWVNFGHYCSRPKRAIAVYQQNLYSRKRMRYSSERRSKSSGSSVNGIYHVLAPVHVPIPDPVTINSDATTDPSHVHAPARPLKWQQQPTMAAAATQQLPLTVQLARQLQMLQRV